MFFKGGDVPPPPAPPKPPSPTTAADNVKKQQTLDDIKRARGMASTILTSGTGVSNAGDSQKKTLLGS